MAEEKCNPCWMCHKQAGLPILLTRYAVASAKPETTAALYGENESDEPRVVVWDDASPELMDAFKVEDKPNGKTIPLGDGARYTLRLLRPGYVYVYNPKDPDGKEWRGYEVTDQQYLEEFSVCSERSMCRKEGAEKMAPCNPDKNELLARCITIPGAEDAETIWIGFSDTKWTKYLLKQNEDESFRNRHMRRFDVKKYLEAKKHDHAVCVHELKPESSGRIPPIIAEYAYRRLIDKRYVNSKTALFEETEEPGVFSFSPVPLQRLGSRNEPFIPFLGTPIYTKKEPMQHEEYNTRMSTLQMQIDSDREEKQEILSKGEPSTEQKARVKELDLRINKSQIEQTELDGLYTSSLAQRRIDRNLRATSDPSGPAARNTEFTNLIRQFKRFYSRVDKKQKSSEQYAGTGMILALDDAPGIVMDLAGMMETRMDAFSKQKAFYRALVDNDCFPLAMVATYDYVKKDMEEYEIRVLAAMGKVKKKTDDEQMEQELRELMERDDLEALGELEPIPEAPTKAPPPEPKRRRFTFDELMNIDRQQSPVQKERLEAMRKLLASPDKILQGCESVWKHHRETHYNEEAQQKFFEPDGPYFTKSAEFGKAAIDPLAEAHGAWFNSDYLIDYFICNFDNTEGKSKGGEPKGSQPKRDSTQIDTVEEQMEEGYRVHGGPFLILLNLCIGTTGSHPISAKMYDDMFAGEDTEPERNLVWVGLNMNRGILFRRVNNTAEAIDAIQKRARKYAEKHAAAFNSDEEPEALLKFEAADFIAKFAWSGWDAFYNAIKTQIEVIPVTPDRTDDKKVVAPKFTNAQEIDVMRTNLERANDAYWDAHFAYEDFHKGFRALLREEKGLKFDAKWLKYDVDSAQRQHDWRTENFNKALDEYFKDQAAAKTGEAKAQAFEQRRAEMIKTCQKLYERSAEAVENFRNRAAELTKIPINGPKSELMIRLNGSVTTLISKHVNAGTFSQHGPFILAATAETGLPPVAVEGYGGPWTAQKQFETLFGMPEGSNGSRFSGMSNGIDPNTRFRIPAAFQPDLDFLINNMFPDPVLTQWWKLRSHSNFAVVGLPVHMRHLIPILKGNAWDPVRNYYDAVLHEGHLQQRLEELIAKRNAANRLEYKSFFSFFDEIWAARKDVYLAEYSKRALERRQGDLTEANEDLHQAKKKYNAKLDEITKFNDEKIKPAYKELVKLADTLDEMYAAKLAARKNAQFAAEQMTLGAGYAAVNAGLALYVLVSWGREFERVKPIMDRDANEYRRAMEMYYASVATFTAAAIDTVQAVASLASLRFAWAARLSTAMRTNPFIRLGTRAGGSALSFVGARWDYEEAKMYDRMGETGWERGYYVAMWLGIASGLTIVVPPLAPFMLPVMGVYALYTTLLYQYSPKPIENWLKQSYFGRHSNPDWTGKRERQVFEYSSGKKAPQKVKTTW